MVFVKTKLFDTDTTFKSYSERTCINMITDSSLQANKFVNMNVIGSFNILIHMHFWDSRWILLSNILHFLEVYVLYTFHHFVEAYRTRQQHVCRFLWIPISSREYVRCFTRGPQRTWNIAHGPIGKFANNEVMFSYLIALLPLNSLYALSFHMSSSHWHGRDNWSQWDSDESQWLTFLIQPTTWLRVAWRFNESGYQQPWDWHRLLGITSFYVQLDKKG